MDGLPKNAYNIYIGLFIEHIWFTVIMIKNKNEIVPSLQKCRTRRDNAGAVCNSGMGMIFLSNLIFFKEGGFIFLCMMHDG